MHNIITCSFKRMINHSSSSNRHLSTIYISIIPKKVTVWQRIIGKWSILTLSRIKRHIQRSRSSIGRCSNSCIHSILGRNRPHNLIERIETSILIDSISCLIKSRSQRLYRQHTLLIDYSSRRSLRKILENIRKNSRQLSKLTWIRKGTDSDRRLYLFKRTHHGSPLVRHMIVGKILRRQSRCLCLCITNTNS